MLLELFSDFVGYKFESDKLDTLPVVSASFDNSLKKFIPTDLYGRKVPYWHAISGFEVVIEYPGDVVKQGLVKPKKTFRKLLPGVFIGAVRYSSKTNTSKLSYVYKVLGPGARGPFFAEDVYYRASQFFSVMACRAMQNRGMANENTK